MKRLIAGLIICSFCIFFTGCNSQNEPAAEAVQDALNISDAQEQSGQPEKSSSAFSQGAEVSQFTSYWDEYAKNFGGTKAIYSSPSMDIDLMPLYLAGLQHQEPYVRWACAYRLFEYYHDDRKLEIIKALEPLLEDSDPNVSKAAEFSTEVLKGTFAGSAFVRSPDGHDVAFFPYVESRFNGGQV